VFQPGELRNEVTTVGVGVIGVGVIAVPRHDRLPINAVVDVVGSYRCVGGLVAYVAYLIDLSELRLDRLMIWQQAGVASFSDPTTDFI
jgi:hypothetical protein